MFGTILQDLSVILIHLPLLPTLISSSESQVMLIIYSLLRASYLDETLGLDTIQIHNLTCSQTQTIDTKLYYLWSDLIL